LPAFLALSFPFPPSPLVDIERIFLSEGGSRARRQVRTPILAAADVPGCLERLLAYIAAVSAAVAALNLAPVWGLDGAHTLAALLPAPARAGRAPGGGEAVSGRARAAVAGATALLAASLLSSFAGLAAGAGD
jgi:Zn-dependent protease